MGATGVGGELLHFSRSFFLERSELANQNDGFACFIRSTTFTEPDSAGRPVGELGKHSKDGNKAGVTCHKQVGRWQGQPGTGGLRAPVPGWPGGRGAGTGGVRNPWQFPAEGGPKLTPGQTQVADAGTPQQSSAPHFSAAAPGKASSRKPRWADEGGISLQQMG